MRTWVYVATVVLASAAAMRAPPAAAQAAPSPPPPRCCDRSPWSNPPSHSPAGMMGRGMMMGSMQRHHQAMMGQLPSAYANLRNPLPVTAATLERGEKIYANQCASCHGPAGLGDGPAAKGLDPAPANLASMSRMPMGTWDPFMYWTVADGGAAYGTAMPAFNSTLAEDDIWAVIAYIQAHLPPPSSHR